MTIFLSNGARCFSWTFTGFELSPQSAACHFPTESSRKRHAVTGVYTICVSLAQVAAAVAANENALVSLSLSAPPRARQLHRPFRHSLLAHLELSPLHVLPADSRHTLYVDEHSERHFSDLLASFQRCGNEQLRCMIANAANS